MTRTAFALALLLAALSGGAEAGTLPFGGFGRRAKTNPRTAALRDYTAIIHTNLGKMTLEFNPEAAPNAVRNFIKLAQRGSYDGMRFYGVFKDRMILTGDPTGTGKGDAGYTIPYETSYTSCQAGAVVMDRTPDGPNSGSRFFIVLNEQPHLDRDFTAFAEVAEGLDVARRIGAARTRPNDGCPAPIEDIVIEKIVVTKKKAQDAKETKD